MSGPASTAVRDKRLTIQLRTDIPRRAAARFLKADHGILLDRAINLRAAG